MQFYYMQVIKIANLFQTRQEKRNSYNEAKSRKMGGIFLDVISELKFFRIELNCE